MPKLRVITKADVTDMCKEITLACERRGWNPYTLNTSQLKEIVSVVVSEKMEV